MAEKGAEAQTVMFLVVRSKDSSFAAGPGNKRSGTVVAASALIG
jgi:hypothetical protein